MQDRWHIGRAGSRWIGGGLLSLALVAVSACGQVNSTGRSASMLIIDSLQAAAGGQTVFSNTLQSDVLTKGAIYEDQGKVLLRVALKDPGNGSAPNAPTTVNSVTVTRYHVSFRRSDGRNTQGVDVPFAFDGAATGTIASGGGTLTFVLVRGQAKLESPLVDLRGNGGSIFLSTVAEVTFYGQDQNGNQVTATGLLSVNFADWADPT
jgi:hypothetical protein